MLGSGAARPLIFWPEHSLSRRSAGLHRRAKVTIRSVWTAAARARDASLPCAVVAQLVRASDCGSEGRWFNSSQPYHSFRKQNQFLRKPANGGNLTCRVAFVLQRLPFICRGFPVSSAAPCDMGCNKPLHSSIGRPPPKSPRDPAERHLRLAVILSLKTMTCHQHMLPRGYE